jgi:hypothetical protein
MSDALQRISALEAQVSQHQRELESLRSRFGDFERVALREGSGIMQPNANTQGQASHGPQPASVAERQQEIARAEALFEGLLSLRSPRLISYSEAYLTIFGTYGVWRNSVHAARVIDIALRTKPRGIGPLTIRLDALIVRKDTLRPSPRHFVTANYSEAEWIRTFGGWSLMAGAPPFRGVGS